MTLQEKAREWAEKEYPTHSITTTIESLAYNIRNLRHRGVAERAYLAGAAGAMEWVPVPKEIMQGTYHYLIPLGEKDVYTHWEIITGYADESGDLFNQHDDEPTGREYKEAIFYMPIAPLPPHPEKESV